MSTDQGEPSSLFIVQYKGKDYETKHKLETFKCELPLKTKVRTLFQTFYDNVRYKHINPNFEIQLMSLPFPDSSVLSYKNTSELDMCLSEKGFTQPNEWYTCELKIEVFSLGQAS